MIIDSRMRRDQHTPLCINATSSLRISHGPITVMKSFSPGKTSILFTGLKRQKFLNEGLNPVTSVKHGDGSEMVWDCFASSGWFAVTKPWILFSIRKSWRRMTVHQFVLWSSSTFGLYSRTTIQNTSSSPFIFSFFSRLALTEAVTSFSLPYLSCLASHVFCLVSSHANLRESLNLVLSNLKNYGFDYGLLNNKKWLQLFRTPHGWPRWLTVDRALSTQIVFIECIWSRSISDGH